MPFAPALFVKTVNPLFAALMGLLVITFPVSNLATNELVKIVAHGQGFYTGQIAKEHFTVYFAEQVSEQTADQPKGNQKEVKKDPVEDIRISIRTKTKDGETLNITYNRKGKTPLNDEESELLKKITDSIVIYNEANKATISNRARYVWQEIKRGLVRK